MREMEVAAAAIAFGQATEMCIKTARAFIQKIRAYREANDRIAELILRIEAIWLKTETQITALKKAKERSNERLQSFHQDCLHRLVAKLYAVDAEIETFTVVGNENRSLPQLPLNHGPGKRIRYSIFESHLRKTIDSLEAWHSVFDPSWFLITLHNDERMDNALGSGSNSSGKDKNVEAVLSIRAVIQQARIQSSTSGSVFRENDFVSTEKIDLLYSSFALASLSSNGNAALIDTTTYPEDIDKQRAFTHVRDLARVLSVSQPSTIGLLQCIGVLKQLDESRKISQFQYIFSLPPESEPFPSSLRELLLKDPVSLDTKFSIAKSLTRGITAVHSADFVHKSVRPGNIVVFNSADDHRCRAYLVGFERSRPSAATTSLTGDMIWDRNIYRHPTRQGIRPEEVYIMQHDIYSLGVCLLEIGLWNSLVLPGEPAKPGKLLHIEEQLSMTNKLKAAWEIKKILTNLAKTFLPSLIGLLNTEVVLSCLTCLDSGADNMFANEQDLYDEDGILVGVVFIEKILSRLESLSIA